MTSAASKITQRERRRAAKKMKKGPTGQGSTSKNVEAEDDADHVTTDDERSEVCFPLPFRPYRRVFSAYVISGLGPERGQFWW